MTNPRIALPSKIKVDMNEISSKPSKPKQRKTVRFDDVFVAIEEIPKVSKPRKMNRYIYSQPWYDRHALKLMALIVLVVLLISAFVASLIPNPVEAQVKTAKDCFTNQCILDIVCAGHSGYVNEKEICSS